MTTTPSRHPICLTREGRKDYWNRELVPRLENSKYKLAAVNAPEFAESVVAKFPGRERDISELLVEAASVSENTFYGVATMLVHLPTRLNKLHIYSNRGAHIQAALFEAYARVATDQACVTNTVDCNAENN